MNFHKSSQDFIFSIDPQNFEKSALSLFIYQAQHNPLYRKFIEELSIQIDQVKALEQIPFLPIEFFKSHQVVSRDFTPEKIFESSGTTGQVRSQHYVADLAFYQAISERAFQLFYGDLTNYHILALLPSYLERDNASLIYMIDYFIRRSASPYSGFYLNHEQLLEEQLPRLSQRADRKVLLIGVTFALLDFAEAHPIDLSSVIVMETGGMKGRRKEMIREEVHQILKQQFNLKAVHSEYGMTELLSQAYSRGEELFQTPPWMKIFLRDVNDPLFVNQSLKSGGINIIDLANIDSCAFIATQDIGAYAPREQFKILGRMDHSDVRGCNLLLA